MSIEIETDMKNHSLTCFWGGDDIGTMVQITARDGEVKSTGWEQLQVEGFVQLDLLEAVNLVNALNKWIPEEMRRRRELLKKQIAGLKVFEKSVFQEIVEMEDTIVEVASRPLVAKLIDAYCPKAPERR